MRAVCIELKPKAFRGSKYFTLRYMREDNTIGEKDYTVSGAQMIKEMNKIECYADFRGKIFPLSHLEGRWSTILRWFKMVLKK